MTERILGRIRTLPPPSPGQFGPDHRAVEVITPDEWQAADPFILLMDDRLDGRLQAGPHPHAGFETVTFSVDGDLPSENRGAGGLAPGDVEWTTAGSGIVHGPDRPIEGRFRVLQLWVTLPKRDRWTKPDHQLVRRQEALVRREAGAEIHLYSGRSGDLISPTRNRVPVTLIDARLEPGAEFSQQVPASHNGFFYVLEGGAEIGGERLAPGQIGWLARAQAGGKEAGTEEGIEDSEVHISAPEGARVLFYGGERQEVPVTWYGPFIGDTREDIVRSFERYQAGTFLRV